jgi:tetratricopeptide (TPR) repeat protein
VRVAADLGQALCHLANFQAGNRQGPVALETYERAVQRLQAAVDKAPTNAHALAQLSDAFFGLAAAQSANNESERAVETCKDGLRVRQRIVDAYPDAPKYRGWLALGHHQLGLVLSQSNRRDEAADAFAQAAEFQEKLVAEQPEVVVHQTALAATYNQQGILCAKANNAPEAIAAFLKEEAVHRRLVDRHPDSLEYQFELGHNDRKLGEFQVIAKWLNDAAGSYRNATALLEEIVPKAPVESQEAWRSELVQSLGGLGKANTQLNKLDDATAALNRALPQLEQLTGQTSVATAAKAELAQDFMNLAEEYRKARKVEPGADAYRQAIKLAGPLAQEQPKVSKYQEYWVLSNVNLGTMYAMNGRQLEALEAWRDTTVVLDKVPPSLTRVRGWRAGLAKNLTALGNDCAAKKLPLPAADAYRLAVEQNQKLVAADSTSEQYRRDLGMANGALANHLRHVKKFPDADAAFGEALSVMEKLAQEHPTNYSYPLLCAAILCDWGAMDNEWGKADEAVTHLDKALPLLEVVLDKEKNPQLLTNARNFTRFNQTQRGHALRKLKRYKEAVTAYEKALELTPEKGRTPLRLDHALVLAQSGDHAKAVAEAEAIVAKDANPSELYDAACVLSLASAAVAADDKLAVEARGKLAEEYATRAVALLRQAQKAGRFKAAADLDFMKKDTDLDPIRSRDDYSNLVFELEEATKGPKD